jgi:CheY-like chemotaxis protein
MKNHQCITILLVEDDPGHALLIEKNLRRAGIASKIMTLADGQKAVDFLFTQGDDSRTILFFDACRPQLVLA